MSIEGNVRVITTHKLLEMKRRGEKIAMLTAYDYTSAKIVDQAGIDIILVGDSAANVMAGHETTLPITIDQMIYHAQSVMRAVKNPLVVVDMPFGTYQGNSKEAVHSAIRIMKESEADAVKVEGGAEIMESVTRILTTGIPVMGHLGLTPQSIHKFGTYAVRAREESEANKLVEDAIALESRLFRFGVGKNSRFISKKSSGNPYDTGYRDRSGKIRGRSGLGHARYAGVEQRFLSPFPAALCQSASGISESVPAICRRCEDRRFSQR